MMLLNTKVNNHLLLKLVTVTDCFGSEPHWIKKAQVLVQHASGTHEDSNGHKYGSLESGMGSLLLFFSLDSRFLSLSVIRVFCTTDSLHHDRLQLLKLGRQLNPPSLCCFCRICYINRKGWLTLLLCVPSLSKIMSARFPLSLSCWSPSTHPCSPTNFLSSVLSHQGCYSMAWNITLLPRIFFTTSGFLTFGCLLPV